MILHVQNFGKIESADIDLDSYVLLVGENNSGKTYLMQLISELDNLLLHCQDYIDLSIKDIVLDQVYDITATEIEHIVKMLNHRIETYKDNFIKKVFNQEIYCEHLSVSFPKAKALQGATFKINNTRKENQLELTLALENKTKKYVIDADHKNNMIAMLIFRAFLFQLSHTIFIPASRTGLQLLYKQFFARSVDRYYIVEDSESEAVNLTKPVYEFLRYLQTFHISNNKDEERQKLISFMETNLIDGNFSMGYNNEMFYTPKNSDFRTSLYLASSMINEFAPFWMVLNDREKKNFILIDEVETSLHPKKQFEMARFLNRLNNAGCKLVISTHSDTMASRINHLCLLSEMKQRGDNIDDKLAHLQLSFADLPTRTINAYQFKNVGNKSVVEKVPYNPMTGFAFQQFEDAIDILLQEAEDIMGN